MRIGVVVHGPEAIDTGLAIQVIDLLSNFGEVKAYVGGATGIIAVIDAGLEQRIDISRTEKPSEAISRLDPESTHLILVNYCKREETGIAFGRAVASRAKITKPLVQVDNNFVISWNADGEELAREISDKLSKKIIVPTKNENKTPPNVRRVVGVAKGENVWVNGTVIGRAKSEVVELYQGRDGKIQFSGVEVKEHVLNRLENLDIEKAIIRSGVIRRTSREPRSMPTKKKKVVCIIDHDAERLAHKFRDASAVVTIGDDTTRVAGDLLSRYDIPIIGITDGDEDGICSDRNLAPGSVILTLEKGMDDVAAKVIKKQIFKDENEIPFRSLNDLELMVMEALSAVPTKSVERVPPRSDW
ncbi:MAG: DUF2117 domain-containing protein [Candidatus Methanosuratus sp.]|nr:DUF2117 domain-containing protein [Candidatus Methanosuratincola sp.]